MSSYPSFWSKPSPTDFRGVVVIPFFLLVSIVHDWLNVVSRKESSDAVADTFEPAIIVLLDDVDDGSLHEGQLVLFILRVVVNSHNWEQKKKCTKKDAFWKGASQNKTKNF